MSERERERGEITNEKEREEGGGGGGGGENVENMVGLTDSRSTHLCDSHLP